MSAGLSRSISLLLALSASALAQSGLGQMSTAPVLKFTTAEIKAVNQAGYGEMYNLWPAGFSPGHVRIPGATLAAIIAEAYGLSRYQFDIDMPTMPGPAWIENDNYFAIDATAPPTTSLADMRKMLQNLLADRFKLVVHWETRDMPAYALNTVNGGPQPTGEDPAKSFDQILSAPEIVATLADYLRTPVVDMTNLTGNYIWTLSEGDFCQSAVPPLGRKPTPEEASQAQLPACQAKLSIFAVLQSKMKLTIEPHDKLPVRVMVIDRVERPSQP
jgi:uncharacterized protein (TIGR03435 family)